MLDELVEKFPGMAERAKRKGYAYYLYYKGKKAPKKFKSDIDRWRHIMKISEKVEEDRSLDEIAEAIQEVTTTTRKDEHSREL